MYVNRVLVAILRTKYKGLYNENDCIMNTAEVKVNDVISANTVNGAIPNDFIDGYIVP